MTQEASGSAADTVTVNGKEQVDPGATKEGAGDIDVLVTEVEGKSCVPDLGPLPTINPAPSPRREVVEGPALNEAGVEARPPEKVPERAS